MKTSFRLALASAALLAAAVPISALAQAPRAGAAGLAKPAAPAAAGNKVGLVDMSHIFSNYEKLKFRREQLQKEFEAASPEIQNIQKQMTDIQKELTAGTVAKGSERWTALETQLTELKAQGQAKAANLQREFIRKEVAIYKEIHEEVSLLVSQYAVAYQYSLILRYQRDPEDAEAGEDPNAVMNRINQLVVYHQPADDITNALLNKLNERYLGAGGKAASATKAADGAAAPAAALPTRR